MIDYRKAEVRDWPRLIPAFREVEAYHRSQAPQVFKAPTDAAIKELLLSFIHGEGVATFIAERDSEVVGFIQAILNWGKDDLLNFARTTGTINSISVLRSHRHQGIGRVLMQTAEQWLKSHGATDILLNVWEFNLDALSFYKEIGYETYSRKLIKARSPSG